MKIQVFLDNESIYILDTKGVNGNSFAELLKQVGNKLFAQWEMEVPQRDHKIRLKEIE